MRFSPGVHPRVAELLDELDDGRSAIAEIWRETGRRARAEGLFQPSYATARTIVRVNREDRARSAARRKRAADLALDFVFATRSPKEIMLDMLDMLDGLDPEPRDSL